MAYIYYIISSDNKYAYVGQAGGSLFTSGTTASGVHYQGRLWDHFIEAMNGASSDSSVSIIRGDLFQNLKILVFGGPNYGLTNQEYEEFFRTWRVARENPNAQNVRGELTRKSSGRQDYYIDPNGNKIYRTDNEGNQMFIDEAQKLNAAEILHIAIAQKSFIVDNKSMGSQSSGIFTNVAEPGIRLSRKTNPAQAYDWITTNWNTIRLLDREQKQIFNHFFNSQKVREQMALIYLRSYTQNETGRYSTFIKEFYNKCLVPYVHNEMPLLISMSLGSSVSIHIKPIEKWQVELERFGKKITETIRTALKGLKVRYKKQHEINTTLIEAIRAIVENIKFDFSIDLNKFVDVKITSNKQKAHWALHRTYKDFLPDYTESNLQSFLQYYAINNMLIAYHNISKETPTSYDRFVAYEDSRPQAWIIQTNNYATSLSEKLKSYYRQQGFGEAYMSNWDRYYIPIINFIMRNRLYLHQWESVSSLDSSFDSIVNPSMRMMIDINNYIFEPLTSQIIYQGFFATPFQRACALSPGKGYIKTF